MLTESMLVLAICRRRAFISANMVGLSGTAAIDRGTALCTCGRTREYLVGVVHSVEATKELPCHKHERDEVVLLKDV